MTFLSRKQCNQLRGLAIISIVLHNFVHQTRFGFTSQNESSFDLTRTQEFLERFCQEGFWSAVCEVFSFLGWIGVPVFVFLSGYGLVKKYEQGSTPLKVKDFIAHSWAKLFLLMLPGVLFCALYHQFTGLGGLHTHLKYAVYLSLLGNLVGIDTMTPSIYWYFGLTFELYLAYILLHRFRSKGVLIGCIAIPLLLQLGLVLGGQDNLVHFNLRNLIGWLPVFCTGIYLGRSETSGLETGGKRCARWLYLLLLLGSSALLVLCNLSPWSWVFIHYFALLFFYSLIRLWDGLSPVESLFAFVGTWSSFIFACHPISRIIVNACRLDAHGLGLGWELLLYLLLILALAPLYKYIVVKLTQLISRIHLKS